MDEHDPHRVVGTEPEVARPPALVVLGEQVPQVVGVKEASGDLEQVGDILLHRPDDFAVYAGDDEITLPLVAMGGDGVVSVLSNALPEQMSSMVSAGLDGDYASAREHHFELLPAMRACFLETNPVPIKDVCAALGWMEPHVRLPLLTMDERAPVRQRILGAFDPFLDVAA